MLPSKQIILAEFLLTWLRANKALYNGDGRITTNYRVGIGTTNPSYTLHCNGKAYLSQGCNINGQWQSKDYSNSQADWWYKNTGHISSNPPNVGIGLHVNKCVEAEAFIVTSDIRIKKNIKDIADNEALSQLRLIKPKTYEYIDSYNKRRGQVLGFRRDISRAGRPGGGADGARLDDHRDHRDHRSARSARSAP